MIIIISGTNRPGSNTRKVTSHVEAAHAALSIPTQVLDLADLPPEIFLPAAYEKSPTSFKKFIDAILAADGIVVVTPEYNGVVPGILKYFIDMLPFPESFEHRPVCFVGLAAGIWGALRPVEQLQAIFGYRNAHIFPDRVFMPGVGKLLNTNGDFADLEMKKRLEKQAVGFIGFVGKLHAKKCCKECLAATTNIRSKIISAKNSTMTTKMITKSNTRLLFGLALFLAIAAATFTLRAAEPPQVGAAAPDFTLKTMDAKSVTLSAETAKLPVVLVVLRGWPGYQCPFCTRQVNEFVQQADAFNGKARVIMVYPGPAENLQAHADEFLKDKSWPKGFLFVTDPDYAFTKSYGLRWDAPGETSYPSTFVIDSKGVVQFAKISKGHGGRASTTEALAVLEKMK